ncbi:MAG: DUF11 domain-containing protein [Planctomycetaceae bacterium]|nr:MAG: DUF11 domain-containing protein [Planctomycetaceae bacterium]
MSKTNSTDHATGPNPMRIERNWLRADRQGQANAAARWSTGLALVGITWLVPLVGCGGGHRTTVLSEVVGRGPLANPSAPAFSSEQPHPTRSVVAEPPRIESARPTVAQAAESAGAAGYSGDIRQAGYGEMEGGQAVSRAGAVASPGCPSGHCVAGGGACWACASARQGGLGMAAAGSFCPPGAAGYPGPGWVPNPQGIDPNEFLCNGDDAPPPARAAAGDRIVGVGLEDTVARYTTERGDVHVEPSNRVCVYAPRFGTVRRVTGAELGELAVGTRRVARQDGPIGIDRELPGLAVTGRDRPGRNDRTRGPDALRARDRGVPMENVLQPLLAAEVLELLANLSIIQRGELILDDLPLLERCVEAAITWSVDEEVAAVVAGQTAATVIRDQVARELVVYEFPDGRLRICKVADRADAAPGDTVTFMLRVDNVGDSPLRDIVITDSLTTRLAYVEDSQVSSREAEFSVIENEGQSLRLTWKLAGELKVGEGATIEFKCRVR